MLEEAKRLYSLGWAVHWIRPKSKVPVKAGWSGAVRDTWEVLQREYRRGFGLGVRMGESSALIGGGFLANIDVDLKSRKTRHRTEAFRLLDEHFPGIRKSAPCVKTGMGFRFFVRTETPWTSVKLGASSETAVVLLPTAEVNDKQRKALAAGLITQAELDSGYRVRGAWEVELMSIGKQVVLPPSIHPDTNEPYTWLRPLAGALPWIVESCGSASKAITRASAKSSERFEPVPVDLVSSKLSSRIVDMILTGEGVEDRSAACYAVSIAMTKAGFSPREVLSCLTDRSTYLGDTPYEHRSTQSRQAAAAWVQKYCLDKAVATTSAAAVFEREAEVETVLPVAQAEAQQRELVQTTDWRTKLQRTGKDGKGPPQPTLRNTILVLTNAVAKDLFHYDAFSVREAYTVKAPWTGGRAGKATEDIDATNIKYWLARKFGFEPSVNTVFEAMGVIASKNTIHPVRRELLGLKRWDGQPRIDRWLKDYFKAQGPAEYLAQVLRKWMVASIARVFEPGLKFDWMPILEGKQGCGKSSFGAILFGQRFFADWLPRLDDKDAALGLSGLRCVEFGELEGLRRNELETVKAFVTRQVDKVRPPFGRKTIELLRQCVFFGTTNKEHYFRDETGNRRFNPVVVGPLNWDALHGDRDQLWAEALFVYQNNLETTLCLEGDAAAHAVEAQREKMVLDDTSLMSDALLDSLGSPKADQEFNFTKFKLPALFEGFGPLNRWSFDARNIQFAAKALRDLTLKAPEYTVKKTRIQGFAYYSIKRQG